MFKKKLIRADDEEDDDYEYIGDENAKNPNKTSASIKNDSLSSGISTNDSPSSSLSTNDKKVKYRNFMI